MELADFISNVKQGEIIL